MPLSKNPLVIYISDQTLKPRSLSHRRRHLTKSPLGISPARTTDPAFSPRSTRSTTSLSAASRSPPRAQPRATPVPDGLRPRRSLPPAIAAATPTSPPPSSSFSSLVSLSLMLSLSLSFLVGQGDLHGHGMELFLHRSSPVPRPGLLVPSHARGRLYCLLRRVASLARTQIQEPRQVRRHPLHRSHDPTAAYFAPSCSATAEDPRRWEPPPRPSDWPDLPRPWVPCLCIPPLVIFRIVVTSCCFCWCEQHQVTRSQHSRSPR